MKNDLETLSRVTGLEVLPDDLVEEYKVWLNMYHRSGASGPIGAIACVALARHMGIKPPEKKIMAGEIDWRKQPRDTKVKVRIGKYWEPGVFVGFVYGGNLSVRLDKDDYVTEARRFDVRLADDDSLLAEKEESFADDFGDDENVLDATGAESGVIQKTGEPLVAGK